MRHEMRHPTRRWLGLGALALVLGSAAGLARAGEEKKAPAPAPVLATDEEAAAALATFKEDFKAKGLKGDERTAQRDWAMSKLAKVQHPLVVDAIAEATRASDARLRTIAVLYLGDLKLLPGSAGSKVEQAMDRNPKDMVLVLSGLDSIGLLKYVGAHERIAELLRQDNFVLKKAAALAAGETRDVRLLPELLKILGVEVKGEDSQGEVVVSEGASWEGAEAHVDTGTPGDSDQREAERQVAEQLARNQAAAGAAAGGGGGPSAGTGGGQGGKGGSSRSLKELAPHILKALKKITGEDFSNGKQIAEWLGKNKEWLAAETKRVAELDKKQADEGKGS